MARTPLAWKSFTHNKVKFLSSVGGVAFAVILMFVEMGFLNGLFDAHTRVVDLLDGDLLMVNVDKLAVIPKLPFAKRHLQQARGVPGVASVAEVRVDEMRSMFKDLEHRRDYPMFVYGIDPDNPPFRLPGLKAEAQKLKVLDAVLLDEQSKDFYGDVHPGHDVEIAERRLHVVGNFALGPDFRADGNAMVSTRTFLDMYPGPRGAEDELVEFGLIRLAPGADRDAVKRAIVGRVSPAVSVLAPEEFSTRVRYFWGQSKPVGFVFGLGLAVGFLIGLTICYQILYVDICDHLPQYATLKAIGYDNAYLLSIVLKQAMYLAVIGFAAGLGVSRAVYAAVEYFTKVPMFFTVLRVGGVGVLTLVMCVVSGFIAIGKALDADPAEVF